MKEKEKYYLRITNFPSILVRWLERFADDEMSGKVMAEFHKLSAINHSFASAESFGTFLERSSEILQQPDFAMRLAMDTPPSVSQDNRAILFLYYARSIQDWLRTMMAALPSRCNMFQTTLEADQNGHLDDLVIGVSPRYEVSEFRQVTQYLAYDFAKLFSQLNHVSKGGVKKLHIPHDRPRHVNCFDDGTVEWNSPAFEMIIDRKTMDRPLRVPVSSIQSMFTEASGFLVPHTMGPDDTLLNQVEIAISLLMGTGRCNIEEVAVLLRSTAKKLQRTLSANEQTFSMILGRCAAQSRLRHACQDRSTHQAHCRCVGLFFQQILCLGLQAVDRRKPQALS